MGLFDIFKKREPAAPAKPESVAAEASADVLAAPCSGKVIAMTSVPDAVFAGEMMGKGCAIWPDADVVYAPCDAEVSVTMGHAVGMTSTDGVEVLVHVGVDTVEMNGKGFTAYVSQGDTVKAGQPLMSIDRKAIAEAGHPDCVVLIVSNTSDFAAVDMAVEAESTVAAGQAVVKISR